jgi:peptidoglycan hydrolase-like protein with peptidoglycan-binding domain
MNSNATRKQLLLLAVIVVSGIFYVGIGAVRNEDTSAPTTSVPATSTTTLDAGTTSTAVATEITTTTIAVGDLVGEDPASNEPCTIPMKALRPGTSGKNVVCLQQALVKNNFLKKVTGTYDVLTQVAVTALQTEKDLFVDGIAGRETALALGIWPNENLLVVRTPPPAPGAKDSLGFLLSSVASTGASAPALPANSGSGRRLVFERAGQRVWAVSKNDEIIRSWLVSGSKYSNETVGTHQVYSRSEITTAWNGKAFLKKMVRWLKTEIGAIGFHQIPVRRSDNTVYQTEAELGTRLSGGCQRQAKLDADFLWSFAKIGTPVVVL